MGSNPVKVFALPGFKMGLLGVVRVFPHISLPQTRYLLEKPTLGVFYHRSAILLTFLAVWVLENGQ